MKIDLEMIKKELTRNVNTSYSFVHFRLQICHAGTHHLVRPTWELILEAGMESTMDEYPKEEAGMTMRLRN